MLGLSPPSMLNRILISDYAMCDVCTQLIMLTQVGRASKISVCLSSFVSVHTCLYGHEYLFDTKY